VKQNGLCRDDEAPPAGHAVRTTSGARPQGRAGEETDFLPAPGDDGASESHVRAGLAGVVGRGSKAPQRGQQRDRRRDLCAAMGTTRQTDQVHDHTRANPPGQEGSESGHGDLEHRSRPTRPAAGGPAARDRCAWPAEGRGGRRWRRRRARRAPRFTEDHRPGRARVASIASDRCQSRSRPARNTGLSRSSTTGKHCREISDVTRNT
jgi:hypothetical protein